MRFKQTVETEFGSVKMFWGIVMFSLLSVLGQLLCNFYLQDFRCPSQLGTHSSGAEREGLGHAQPCEQYEPRMASEQTSLS